MHAEEIIAALRRGASLYEWKEGRRKVIVLVEQSQPTQISRSAIKKLVNSGLLETEQRGVNDTYYVIPKEKLVK